VEGPDRAAPDRAGGYSGEWGVSNLKWQ